MPLYPPAGGSGSASQLPGMSGFRLSLASGIAVPTTDQTAKTTIYLTPFTSNRLWLYDGSSTWAQKTSAEISLALGTVFNAQAYDLFAYDNAGTLTLDPVEWSNAAATMTIATPCVVTWTAHGLLTGDPVTFTTSGALPTGLAVETQYWITKVDANTFNLSTSLVTLAAGTLIATSGTQSGTHTAHSPRNRQTALATQDGVYVKSGATTRLYVGTFMTTSTTTTEDSYGGASQAGGKRFLWNAYNRVSRSIGVIDTANSWTYTTATWRAVQAAAGNRVDYVVGLSVDEVSAKVHAIVTSSNTGGSQSSGVGLDSTNANSAKSFGNTSIITTGGVGGVAMSEYVGYPGIGYHSLNWLEISTASGTVTWYGDNGLTYLQSGLIAKVMA